MTTYESNQNMEFGEQVLRGGVGLIMLETVLLSPALSPAIIAGLCIAALYMVFTAITGWDPVYATVKARSPKVEIPGGRVTAFPVRDVRVREEQRRAA